MGIYTQLEFKYLAGSDAKKADPERLGVMMASIIDRFCSPNYWDTADTVTCYVDIDDTSYHWQCVLKDKARQTIMVIGVLQRNKGDAVEYHS
jgi:hypothetical protein